MKANNWRKWNALLCHSQFNEKIKKSEGYNITKKQLIRKNEEALQVWRKVHKIKDEIDE